MEGLGKYLFVFEFFEEFIIIGWFLILIEFSNFGDFEIF